MSIFHRVGIFGQPGSGKSTIGLSYPGVEQHVFGSSEEDTAMNFNGRTDILTPVKPDWFACLKPEESVKFTDDKTSEKEIAGLSQIARARNIANYRRYLYRLKAELIAGKRPEVKSIFLDNGTPFLQEFEDYVAVVFKDEFMTDAGNFNSIKFSIKFQSEVSDFLRFFYSLPCHTIMSFHISMTIDEESAAKANFMEDTKKGVKYPKEWQPMIYGKAKYSIASIPTWALFVWAEESAGKDNQFFAKLEADSSNVGIAKGRIQPFKDPRKIPMPKGTFYQFLEGEINSKYGQNKSAS